MSGFSSESPISAVIPFLPVLPGIAAVITHRLGNSDGEHTTQQKVLVFEAQTSSLNYPLEKIPEAWL